MTKKHDITSTERLLARIRLDQSGKSDSSGDGRPGLEPLPAGGLQMRASASPVTVSRPVSPAAATPRNQAKQRGSLFSGLGRKKATVGVELRVDGLGLALLSASGTSVEHSTVRFVPYEQDVFSDEETLLADLLDAGWFPSFLQKELGRFCAGTRNLQLWCGLPRESVKVHNVVIPKVPDEEVADSVYWTMQKEEPFDRDNTILDFDLIKEVEKDSLTRILAIVYLVRRDDVENLGKLFRKTGFPLTGISTPTVALQNEIRRNCFASEDESFSRLVIGENKSFIEIYFRNALVFSRDIKTGIASFMDSLIEMAAARGVILSEEQCRELILAEDLKTAAPVGENRLFSEGEGDIFDLGLQAPVRLVRQIERTFDFFRNNFQIPRCTSIHLSGIPFNDTRFAAYLSSETGMPCYVHSPFAGLARPVNIAPADSAGGGYRLASAFDLALSQPDQTKNFLLPRAEKEKQQQEKKINRIAMFSAAVLLTACALVFSWQRGQLQDKQALLQATSSELGRVGFVDETQANSLLMAELGKLKEKGRQLTVLGERYLPLALLGQITTSLPPEIRLLRLQLGDMMPTDKKGGQQEGVRSISLEGIVTGNRGQMEFILAKYIRKLAGYSFIISAIVLEKAADSYNDAEVLSFTVEIKAALDSTKLNEENKG